jgi:hypothetical protein
VNAVPDEIREQVALPDPEQQPLVHPLDLPEARGLFRTGWLISAFTSLPVAFLLAAILGYLGHTVVGPIMLFLALVLIGHFAARWNVDRSWDHIPRKRQDRARPLPRRWEVISAGILAVVLGAALLLIVFRLDNDDVPIDVRAYTFGMVVVAAVLVVAGTLLAAVRRHAYERLPGAAVVALAAVLAWVRWFPGAVPAGLLLGGALTMIAAAAIAGAVQLWQSRRQAAEQLS